jgi:murein L,D-transpeptidase YafK
MIAVLRKSISSRLRLLPLLAFVSGISVAQGNGLTPLPSRRIAQVSVPAVSQASPPAAAPITVPAPSSAAIAVAPQSASADAVPTSLVQIPISSNFYSPYAFVVDKTARQLTVWQQSPGGMKEVARFPADLGKSTGEKKSEGDYKTPEGIYFLQEKREGASLDFNLYGKRAFTTDYPNYFDRLEGRTGSGIWLHAVPDHVALTRGSRGCVVVRNDVILNISQYVKLGRTPILIQDRLQTIAAAELAKTTNDVNQWVEGWRAAWETKNIDSYIENYADNFRSLRMNRNQWRRYKQRLASSYKSIGVRLSKPAVYVDRTHAIVRFIQEYTSELHSDVGEKVLFLKKAGDTYKIVGETWSEESSPLARQEVEGAKAVQSTTASAPACTSGSACTAAVSQ